MSVYQNITYGLKPTPSEDEVKEALKLAQAWDFVDAKPDKLMTELTATGGGFSGGQMQRLSIARALIRKPDVILLDEATAALDPVNERAVQDTLDRVMKGYTTLVIAHRLTTIKDSDKIIVIDHGKVVEEGTHEQLLKIQVEAEVDKDGKKTIKSGFYHNQWRTQFAEKGLTTKQLKEKVAQLQLQMETYKAKISRTRRLMKKWQSAGLFAHLFEQVQREDSQEAFEDVPEMPQFDRDTTAMSYLTAGEAVITELLTPSGGQALIEF
jgi:ABC-type multidrug transport system ATPase subunit